MSLGAYIKQYRERHRMTMQEFATASGLSKGYISMLESNKNPHNNRQIIPSINTFEKVATAMGITTNELLENMGEEQLVSLKDNDAQYRRHEGIMVPVLGTIVAGLPISAYEDILDYEEITPKMAASGEYYALRVQGHSMEPRICEGDTVIIKVQPDVETGDIAVILVNGEAATLKRVVKVEAGIMLTAFNTAVYEPHFYTHEQIKTLPLIISGRMVELRARF